MFNAKRTQPMLVAKENVPMSIAISYGTLPMFIGKLLVRTKGTQAILVAIERYQCQLLWTATNVRC